VVWERKHVEFIHETETELQPFSAVGKGLTEGTQVRVLSQDYGDGASSCIWHIPAGWSHREAFITSAPEQLYVLEGDLHKGDYTYTEGRYSFRPAGAIHEPMWSENGAKVLAFWDKAFDVLPLEEGAGAAPSEEPIPLIDTIKMHWQPTIAEGPSAGILVKVLRHVKETGEMTFVTGVLPYWREDRREHHDCVEESYKITGDMNLNMSLGDRMLMEENCYFYRPPYRKHGPLFTKRGTMSLIRISSTLVNHYEPLPPNIQKTPELTGRYAD
jgi:hypothetical protein